MFGGKGVNSVKALALGKSRFQFLLDARIFGLDSGKGSGIYQLS